MLIMSVNQQLNLNVKLYKAFKSCKLKGRWNLKKNSFHEYVALDEGASIILYGIRSEWNEIFSFKKDSTVTIKNSIIEYYDNDVISKSE